LNTQITRKTRKAVGDCRARQCHVVRHCHIWYIGSSFPCLQELRVSWALAQISGSPPNWINCSFGHSRLSHKISERSFHNFLSYFANTQTDRQTNKLRQKHNLLGGSNNGHQTTLKQLTFYWGKAYIAIMSILKQYLQHIMITIW